MLSEPLFAYAVRSGTLTVTDAAGKSRTFGDGGNPRAAIRLHDRRVEWQILINPKLAVGEAYMDGRLTVEEGGLYDFLEVAARNYANLEAHPLFVAAERIGRVLRYLHTFNPVGRARRNVAHHYDLSGKLYDLFLDRDRQYSCAYFETPEDDLELAQEQKKRHLAAKLLFDRPGLKVLDIGSGWGGLGLYLARECGAEVDGVTLSEEQHKLSNERAMTSGLGDRVRFHLRDYRQVSGRFDRIVSVGMFEHVGAAHYRTFFEKTRELLADEGVMLLHTIGRTSPPGSTNGWLRKYIFPGGYTPALSEVLRAIEKTGMVVTDVEVLRLHYAQTLRHWRRRFMKNWRKAAELYDERFCRMWEFYLAGCEVAFRYMDQVVFQIQIARRQDSVPLTRDYITDYKRERQDRAARDARQSAAQ